MRPVINRIRGATTGGRPTGRHGNGIAQVRALPDGTVLETDADNTVTLTPELQIEVTVENSGNAQEVQVPVRLTLQQSPEPITKTRTIDVIDPGEEKQVVFSDFDRAQIGQQTQLKVEVEPVQGEVNTANKRGSTPSCSSSPPRASRTFQAPRPRGSRSRPRPWRWARSGSPSGAAAALRRARPRSASSWGPQGGPCRLRRLAADAHRRSPSRGGRGGRRPVPRRPPGGRSVSRTAVVRYDAYPGTGGQQSASLALLDAGRTGVVVTAIQGRDYARIYVKELDSGRPSVALSPEEQEAVERAMAS